MQSEIKEAQNDAVKRLNDAIDVLTRATRDMELYKARILATEDLRAQAEAINWALQHLATNVLGNLRLDRMASAQARLLVLDAMQRAQPTTNEE
jgi:hypothetical protein